MIMHRVRHVQRNDNAAIRQPVRAAHPTVLVRQLLFEWLTVRMAHPTVLGLLPSGTFIPCRSTVRGLLSTALFPLRRVRRAHHWVTL